MIAFGALHTTPSESEEGSGLFCAAIVSQEPKGLCKIMQAIETLFGSAV